MIAQVTCSKINTPWRMAIIKITSKFHFGMCKIVASRALTRLNYMVDHWSPIAFVTYSKINTPGQVSIIKIVSKLYFWHVQNCGLKSTKEINNMLDHRSLIVDMACFKINTLREIVIQKIISKFENDKLNTVAYSACIRLITCLTTGHSLLIWHVSKYIHFGG